MQNTWIVILSAATLVLYIMLVICSLMANRVSSRLGELLVTSLKIPNGLHEQVRKALSATCDGYASITIFIFGMMGMLALNSIIFVCEILSKKWTPSLTQLISFYK